MEINIYPANAKHCHPQLLKNNIIVHNRVNIKVLHDYSVIYTHTLCIYYNRYRNVYSSYKKIDRQTNMYMTYIDRQTNTLHR